MNYTYVDIGTADFDTSIDKCDAAAGETVMVVEPLQFYLDALPSGDHITKVCAAIVEDGVCETVDVFYVPPPLIRTLELPEWIRGCNRIKEPHPTVVGYLKADRGISLEQARDQGIIACTTCKLLHFCELRLQYNIDSIQHLKVDTEGCDHLILAAVLAAIRVDGFPPPETIEFERIGYADDPFGNLSTLDYFTNVALNSGYARDPKSDLGLDERVKLRWNNA